MEFVLLVGCTNGLGKGQGDFDLMLVFEDLVMEDKLVLIGSNDEIHAQFYFGMGLAFIDPLGVGFKDGEELFVMGMVSPSRSRRRTKSICLARRP